MSQFAAAKKPPWVRGTVAAAAGLAQPPAPGTPLATSLLATQVAQASHASNAAAATGQIAAAIPTGTIATVPVVAAAQAQQPQQAPAVSTPYGTGLAAITLTQSALPQGAVLQQPGIAIPASLAATTAVNSGMVVELARLPQPGVALPTSLATTQVATVSYPAPRLLAQTAQFQAAAAHSQQAAQQATQVQQTQQTVKQRVFTGTVTKLHENFGFVDEDVFFQISSVKGNLPKAGERVLVEAVYNANMPFKWNATRIQVLPNQLCQVNVQPANSTRPALPPGTAMATTVMTTPVPVGLSIQPAVSLNAQVASISNSQAQFPNVNQQGRWQVQQEMAVIEQIGPQRVNIQFDNRLDGPHPWLQETEYPEIVENKGPRICAVTRRHTSPPLVRREREPRREDRRERYRERYSPPQRKRSRSPRRPSRSPPRRRQRIMPRYTVQVPKISLDVKEGNLMELRKRYANLYIPSDFCSANFLWQEAFPIHHSFTLDHPTSFHIVNKDSDMYIENESVQDISDADHLYSAKVMLLSSPSVKEIFKKSCALAEESEDAKENFVHPTRLISFLVGLKGKNETVAIGGPWSPSLDGPNPDKDPSVLIRTAIRTCKSLTGIDLSKCSQWYQFAEIYYRRGESTHKGRVLPTRVETVVLFFPDVWSCLPTRVEWDSLLEGYKKQLLKKLHEDCETITETQDGDETEYFEKLEPTHYSELDPGSIKVSELKRELEARNMSSKGLKSQLIARLIKALRTEAEDEQAGEKKDGVSEDSKMEFECLNEEEGEEQRKETEEKEKEKETREKERAFLEKKFSMPDKPTVVVRPSKTAKGGKFDCTIMSLSLLLDYRQEDNKEHSFEVSLFAELFNEMMMRDFGFRIYQALAEAPDAKEDEKDKKKKDESKYKKDDKDEYRRKEDIDNDSEKDEDDSYEDDDTDEKKEKKRRRKKKVQMYTHDPYLLLACVYYDQSHCGYLMDKDLEEILYTLGLQLSRAQVRKLIQKVCKREVFRYRRLTDKPVGEGDKRNGASSPKLNMEELAAGNKKYIPLFEATSTNANQKESDSNDVESKQSRNMVTHRGALVDVTKLLEQLERSERARRDMEQRLKKLEEELDRVSELASTKDKHSKRLSVELEQCQEKLQGTVDELKKTQFQSDKYHRNLSLSRDQLHATITIMDSVLKARPPWSAMPGSTENSSVKKESHLESRSPNVSSKLEKSIVSLKSADSNETVCKDWACKSEKPNACIKNAKESTENVCQDSPCQLGKVNALSEKNTANVNQKNTSNEESRERQNTNNTNSSVTTTVSKKLPCKSEKLNDCMKTAKEYNENVCQTSPCQSEKVDDLSDESSNGNQENTSNEESSKQQNTNGTNNNATPTTAFETSICNKSA